MTFADFWKAYPRKIGKLAAQKAWAKAIKISKPAEIIAGIAPYMENKPEWQDWCHPATFLNQGRWMDEYASVVETVTNAAELDEFTRRRRLTEIVNKRKLELRFNVADITLTTAEREEADRYLQATSKTGLQT